jgi:aromatic-amino-acid transaminase
MFENLTAQPADKILALMAAYRADPRDTKIDLGVGVYKDASGKTPVMRAVKAAEHRLWDTQDSKSYVGLTGDPAFAAVMKDLILGDAVDPASVAAAATPGGTGAIRQAFELLQMASPDARIFMSNPTWPNHPSIAKYLGIPVVEYRYFDAATGGVDFDGMCEDLKAATSGDLILLHGCCHNPTGANLTLEQVTTVAGIVRKTGATALVDIAYQGFGDGLESDAAATRIYAQMIDEVLIAASCSKNFGLYRERTGILMAICKDDATLGLTQSTLAFLNRQNFSFPPDHGARVVTTILNDADLRANWQAELEATRLGMLDLRRQLADELKRLTNSDRFGFLAEHRGMFSRLGTSPEMVEKIRAEHGIYMVGDSRMNIAGLNANTVPILANAIAQAGV